MKSWRLNAFGIENLTLDDAPEREPGPGEVLVRMKALSLNYRDLLVVRGQYDPKLSFPLQPLSDGAGEVIAVGEGVTRWKSGDRVAGIFMQGWIEGGPSEEKAKTALGAAIPGVAAQQVLFDQEGLVAIPDHLSFEEAATLPCAAVTVWHALFTSGKLAPGETVLTQGTGGVSIFAVQFARMTGARVFATSSSDEKLARVAELGASETINYRSIPEWGREIRQQTNRIGVDHVVEVGGAGTLSQSLNAVRMGGHVALIGVLTGGEVNPVPILFRNIKVQGIFVGSREMFEDMNAAITEAKMKPVIGETFGFDDLPKALRRMESATHFGKIVLTV
jgi:NADPH:quinone reductase-like Zn-dependent oxidoreductase